MLLNNKIERITTLLAAKKDLDRQKGEAFNMKVSGIIERQWVLEALNLLLEAELERHTKDHIKDDVSGIL